jgi:hypothetical protein
MRLALSKRPDRVDVPFPLPEDENRSSFQNFVFASYSEFRKTDKDHIRSDSEYYTVSLQPFRLCLYFIRFLD